MNLITTQTKGNSVYELYAVSLVSFCFNKQVRIRTYKLKHIKEENTRGYDYKAWQNEAKRCWVLEFDKNCSIEFDSHKELIKDLISKLRKIKIKKLNSME